MGYFLVYFCFFFFFGGGRGVGGIVRLTSQQHGSVPLGRICSDHCTCCHTGATRGVTVSMSAFLACHQCYCAGSSLAWGLNLRAVACGIF